MPWKQIPKKEMSPKATINAGKLRRSMTNAEKALWKHLRGDFAGAGTHFRRQVPIGQHVADFCCFRYRLIVELDGPVHESPSTKAYDRSREQALRADGYRILRFSNSEVVLDISSVLNRVASALATSTPTPSPSPQGGGESRPAHP
jgi:very-short-patch-repair endonuclease